MHARFSGTLIDLAVSVYYSDGALAFSGEPAWLPAPAKAAVPTPSAASSDAATQSELTNQLPAFFEAYAGGDQATLGRFLAPGTTVTGLGGQLAFRSLTGGTGPAGRGTPPHVPPRGCESPGQAS